MWVVPEDMKKSSSSFGTVMKIAVVCVLVILVILLFQKGDEYECNEVGMYPDPTVSDNDCLRSYVVCISNGVGDFAWKTYSCPLGTRYNRFEGRCIREVELGRLECIDDDTEMVELIGSALSNYQCHQEGVFENSDSQTCQDYILCVRIGSGLHDIHLKCDPELWYSPKDLVCIEKQDHFCDPTGTLIYKYSIGSTSTSTSVITTSTQSSTSRTTLKDIDDYDGSTSDSVLSITSITTLRNSTVTTNMPNTSKNSIYTISVSSTVSISPPTEKTAKVFTTTIPSPTVPSSVIVDGYTCESPGRYLYPSSLDCSQYVLCVWTPKGFRFYLYSCAFPLIFLESRNRCVFGTLEECLNSQISITESIEITTPPISETTTTSMTTEMLSTTTTPTKKSSELVEEFRVCNSPGRFHTIHTLNCKSYLLCTFSHRGRLIGAYMNCPDDTRFNPLFGRCILEDNYKCPYFYCFSLGRFPYRKSSKKYILCTKHATSELLIATIMKCPKNTVFSYSRRCVRSSSYYANMKRRALNESDIR